MTTRKRAGTSPAETNMEEVLREHQELRSLVGKLRMFLARPRPALGGDGAHRWASELARDLVELHDRVSTHFHEEEASGLMDELRRRHPRASNSVARLEREHERILAGFRPLLGSAMNYAESRQPEIVNLRRSTLDLLRLLDRHEARETDLIQRLSWEDLGVAD